MMYTRKQLNFHTASAVGDFCIHSIRACLKEFHNTHQVKSEEGGTSPQVINLTQH